MKKRIALSIVAALAGGLLAAAPASAASAYAFDYNDNVGYGSATYLGSDTTGAIYKTSISQVAGTNNYVAIPAIADASNAVSVSSNASLVLASATCDAGAGGQSGSISGSTTVLLGASLLDATCVAKYGTGSNITASSDAYIKVPTTTAGTIVVNVYQTSDNAGQVTTTEVQRYTIVVSATTSVTYGTTAVTTSNAWYEDANGDFFVPLADNNKAVDITATQLGSNGLDLADTAAKKVEFSITGVGSLGTTNYVQYAVQDAGVNNVASTSVYSDGRNGTAKVSVSVDGKVLKTYNVNFYGQPASAAVKVNRSVAHAANTTYAAAWNGLVAPAFELTMKDAKGILLPDFAGSLSVTSSNLLAIDPSGYVAQDDGTYTDSWAHGFDLRGAANAVSGSKATLTWTIVNPDASTVTATADATVGGAAATVTVALDKATYAQGEKATLTITGKDASGNPVYDGASLVGALTSNVAAQGTPTAAKTAVAGKATATIYAPTAAGTWTLAGYDANSAAVSVSATVSSAADVAANAAAVATLQTSVAALQTTVASLVASLTAQIKVINSALAKIAKKLKVKI